MTVLGCLWALASPLFSVPDEPAHTIRAAAAARGQILPGERTERGYSTTVEVPAIFAKASAVPICYAFNGAATAGCAVPFTGSTATSDIETNAGYYPPAFYAVAGLPSLLFPSATGVYLMRAVSAAICGALLASAVASAWCLPRPRLLVAGIAFAITPMVFFLAGSVNPNGVEIAAAVCLWAALGVVLLVPDAPDRGRLLARVGVAGVILALSRPLSPFFVALIVATTVALAGWRPLFALARDRRAQFAAGAIAMSCLTTTVWVQAYGTLEQVVGGAGTQAPLLQNLRMAAGTTPVQVQQMVGVFGWLDTGPATLSVFVWLFGVGALLLLGLASSPRRGAVVLLALVAAVVVVPVALEAPRAATQGFPWQGRYSLPLAAGIPILAALQIDRARVLPDRLVRSLGTCLLTLFVAGHLYAHFWATRRYTAGVKGTLNWLAAPGWDPAVPVWLLFVGFVVALPLTAIALRWQMLARTESLLSETGQSPRAVSAELDDGARTGPSGASTPPSVTPDVDGRSQVQPVLPTF
jgi:Predicted membrane protein (DUF2142)